MKRLQNIFLAVISFAVVSCVEDITTDMPSANSGDEVQFGLSLDGLTRTAYGTENTEGTAFPIYWVNGDKVLVASPQCLTGRNIAEYQVSVAGAAQNYADNLTKTGDAGVQWGSSDATFYSVYPSANTSLTIDGTNVTATMNIASTQSVNYTLVDGTYYAASMENVAMYAKTSSISKGSVVNLNYKPLSTVVEFELNVGTATGSIFIESLILEAGENNIAGEFTFDFSTATYGTGENQKQYPVVTSTSGSNTITMEFATQPELDKTNPVLKAKMCLMPVSGVTSLDGWIVKANVRTGADNTKATYKKTIATATNESTALIPGLVHKVKLPILPTGDAWEYQPEEWMPQLPNYRNIYLTELSIPGAWYAGAPVKDEDGDGTIDTYQATNNIQTLWDSGVRAFAVETRTAVQDIAQVLGIGDPVTPVSVVVSGTGPNSTGKERTGLNSLVKTNDNLQSGYDGTEYSYAITDITTDNAVKLSTIIKDIAAVVTDKEFAVLVLSYADGGKGGRRNVDYGSWLYFIQSELNVFLNDTNNAEIKDRIYTDAITSNTTVGDVLGHVIIKINVDKNIAKEGYLIGRKNVGSIIKPSYEYSISNTYAYSNNTTALISYNPFLTQIGSDYYTTPLFSKLYWKTWGDGDAYRNYYDEYNSSDFWWCFNSANRTHTDGTGTYEIPTYSQRKAALNAMIEHSKEITVNSGHNVWFYFNVGGVEASDKDTDTETGAATTFAGIMNPWLLSIINNKTNGYTDDKGVLHPSEPSPLGIVMFNQCTNDTYNGPEIIRAIIEMNNKFKLQYAVQ